MSSRTRASAPGKVVLSGEYAVLDGAPAVCMAVDRRARATVADGDARGTVVAPTFADAVGRFRFESDALVWDEGGDTFRLADAVLRAVGIRTPVGITLDTSAFETDGNKFGIGSSAALTAALCAALHGGADVYAPALRAHTDLQHGAGSGVDVACAVKGGLIEFRNRISEAIDWPTGLQFRLIWTGKAVSTRDKLAQLASMPSKPSRRALSDAAEAIAAKWRSGDARALLQVYPGWVEALGRFSADYDLGVFGAGHAALVEASAGYDVVYKPCGAGGGDVGIALGVDGGRLDAFVEAHAGSYRHIDCALDPVGVRVDRQ